MQKRSRYKLATVHVVAGNFSWCLILADYTITVTFFAKKGQIFSEILKARRVLVL